MRLIKHRINPWGPHKNQSHESNCNAVFMKEADLSDYTGRNVSFGIMSTLGESHCWLFKLG